MNLMILSRDSKIHIAILFLSLQKLHNYLSKDKENTAGNEDKEADFRSQKNDILTETMDPRVLDTQGPKIYMLNLPYSYVCSSKLWWG